MMKKITALMLAALMALSLAACSGGNQAAETTAAAETEAAAAEAGEFTTVEEGKLYMATNASFAPYEYVADNGDFEGIDVEIAGAIAEKLGLELVVDDMDFGAVITSVQTGKDDIAMAGLTVTEERKQNIDFADVYATGVQVIIVKEGSEIASVDDLNGKMIGCQESTTGYNYCSAAPEDGGYGEENVTAFPNGANAVQALLTDKIDCVVIDQEPAKTFVAENEGLKILDTEFTSEDYAIGVSKENPALLAAINSALAELKADGTVDEILAKYIKAE